MCLIPVQMINATFSGFGSVRVTLKKKTKQKKPNHTADIYNACISARQQLSYSCSFSWAPTSSFAHHWALLMLCSNFLFSSHVNTELKSDRCILWCGFISFQFFLILMLVIFLFRFLVFSAFSFWTTNCTRNNPNSFLRKLHPLPVYHLLPLRFSFSSLPN